VRGAAAASAVTVSWNAEKKNAYRTLEQFSAGGSDFKDHEVGEAALELLKLHWNAGAASWQPPPYATQYSAMYTKKFIADILMPKVKENLPDLPSFLDDDFMHVCLDVLGEFHNACLDKQMGYGVLAAFKRMLPHELLLLYDQRQFAGNIMPDIICEMCLLVYHNNLYTEVSRRYATMFVLVVANTFSSSKPTLSARLHGGYTRRDAAYAAVIIRAIVKETRAFLDPTSMGKRLTQVGHANLWHMSGVETQGSLFSPEVLEGVYFDPVLPVFTGIQRIRGQKHAHVVLALFNYFYVNGFSTHPLQTPEEKAKDARYENVMEQLIAKRINNIAKALHGRQPRQPRPLYSGKLVANYLSGPAV
jgi:hypothetical protein